MFFHDWLILPIGQELQVNIMRNGSKENDLTEKIFVIGTRITFIQREVLYIHVKEPHEMEDVC